MNWQAIAGSLAVVLLGLALQHGCEAQDSSMALLERAETMLENLRRKYNQISNDLMIDFEMDINSKLENLELKLAETLIGPPGQKGVPGPRGSRGSRGPAGPQGSPGPRGSRGRDGPTGPDAKSDESGPTGEPGDIGGTGPSGKTGATGFAGSPGWRGKTGATGSVGPS